MTTKKEKHVEEKAEQEEQPTEAELETTAPPTATCAHTWVTFHNVDRCRYCGMLRPGEPMA